MSMKRMPSRPSPRSARGRLHLSPPLRGARSSCTVRCGTGERLSEESSCIGVLGTRIACFCVEADEQFVGESDADGHFVFSRGEQPVSESREGLVVFGG